MKKNFGRLVLLAAGAWFLRAVGPEVSGIWALTTNLLAAVTIQAGLILSPWVLVVWALGVGLFWDVTTFSALGHHVLLIGGLSILVYTQRGWWVGASAAEQMVGSILAAVTYFVADRILHGLEVRQWSWPFTLSISLVLASFVNGLASVALGWCLETGTRVARVRVSERGR
jgi:cell shape-determining protein MreD